MIDTDKVALDKWHDAMDALVPEERLKMACSMFEFARELVADSIRNEQAGISDVELKRKVFTRFYGQDFDAPTLENILSKFNDT